jgi:iron complex outermembrane recepter protein
MNMADMMGRLCERDQRDGAARRTMKMGGAWLLACWVGCTPAVAEQAASGAQNEPSNALEEITVTARKREENLQQVPVSVTAVTTADLEARSVASLSDVAHSVPNINFQQVVIGGSADSVIYIRGIGQSDTVITADPGVGEYLDGVYLGRVQGIDLDMLDMERIEVLRGPQGTLFGKNTIGGAINLVSARPDASTDHVSGQMEAIGGSFDRADGIANINIPLIQDKLAIRFAVASRNSDGYARRTDGEELADTGKLSGRISALYTPTSNLDFLFALDGTDIHQHNGDYQLVHVAIPPLIALYNAVSPIPYTSQWISSNPYVSNAIGPNADRAKIWGASLTTTWHGPLFDVKSITSYRHNVTENDVSLDGSPLGFFYEYDPVEQHQFSQELQASGTSFSERLKWVGGLYYFQEGAVENSSFNVFPLVLPIIGDLSFNNFANSDNHDYAAYGQGTYSLLDDLHVTAGLRYTYETKRVSIFQDALNTGAVEIPATTKSTDFNSTSPRFGLDYQWNPGLMTYVSAAEGYKSGGFNGRATSVAAFDEFKPEKDWTYEVGVRSDWLERTLRVNASLYYTKYTDIQVTDDTATEQGTPLTLITNAASATIKGGELEILSRPVAGLTLGLNGGYTQARYTSAITTPGGVPPVTPSTHFINTPELNYSLSAEYAVSGLIGGAYSIVPRVDYNHASTEYFDLSNSPYTTQRAYGLVNARLTFKPTDGPWSVAAFATNLTNRRYILGGTDVSASLGYADVLQGPPREWGVDLRYKF